MSGEVKVKRGETPNALPFQPKIVQRPEDITAGSVDKKGQELIASSDLSGEGKPLEGRTALRGGEPTVASLAKKSGIVDTFPNLGDGMKLLIQAYDGRINGEMNGHSNELEKIQAKQKLILEFTQQLTKITSDKDSHEITPEMKEIAEKLKEHGIKVFEADETTFTREKIAMIRADLKSFETSFNGEAQGKMLDIQSADSHYKSFLDAMRMILKYLERLGEKIDNNTMKK